MLFLFDRCHQNAHGGCPRRVAAFRRCALHVDFLWVPTRDMAKSDFNMRDWGESAVTEPSAMTQGKRPCFLGTTEPKNGV